MLLTEKFALESIFCFRKILRRNKWQQKQHGMNEEKTGALKAAIRNGSSFRTYLFADVNFCESFDKKVRQ